MPCLFKPDMHHTRLSIIPCLCGGCLLCCLLLSGLLLRVSSDNVALWGFVRLRLFVFFMDSFFFLARSQARWLLPLISLLSLLASCSVLSLCCATYHLFTMPPILLNQASNPPCPSKPLFGYVTVLLNPSYSVVSCRWRLEFVPCWNMDICWDITISLI